MIRLLFTTLLLLTACGQGSEDAPSDPSFAPATTPPAVEEVAYRTLVCLQPSSLAPSCTLYPEALLPDVATVPCVFQPERIAVDFSLITSEDQAVIEGLGLESLNCLTYSFKAEGVRIIVKALSNQNLPLAADYADLGELMPTLLSAESLLRSAGLELPAIRISEADYTGSAGDAAIASADCNANDAPAIVFYKAQLPDYFGPLSEKQQVLSFIAILTHEHGHCHLRLDHAADGLMGESLGWFSDDDAGVDSLIELLRDFAEEHEVAVDISVFEELRSEPSLTDI